jgi:hypothetical protein
MRRKGISIRLAGAAIALAAVSACHPGAERSDAASNQSEFAETGGLPPSQVTNFARAPDENALPAAAPLAIDYDAQPRAAFAPIDEADALLETIGDGPPDYLFGYDGVQPWGWDTLDGYSIFAEPVTDGLRYYYYAPRSDVPFLVRDPGYSYAYDDGRIIAVYALDGRRLSRGEARMRAEAASRYYARARLLRSASSRRGQVPPRRWAAQRHAAFAARQAWETGRARQPEWREVHARRQAAANHRRRDEAGARESAARRFARWQVASFSGAPPRLYDPARGGSAARLLAGRHEAGRTVMQRPPLPRDNAARRGHAERDNHSARAQRPVPSRRTATASPVSQVPAPAARRAVRTQRADRQEHRREAAQAPIRQRVSATHGTAQVRARQQQRASHPRTSGHAAPAAQTRRAAPQVRGRMHAPPAVQSRPQTPRATRSPAPQPRGRASPNRGHSQGARPGPHH